MKYVQFEKAFTALLPLELYENCQSMASSEHVPMAEIVRIALSRYFKTKKKGKKNV